MAKKDEKKALVIPPIGEVVEYSADQIALIKRTVAAGSSDDELLMFLHLAKTYHLDPFIKEIQFYKQKKWNEYKQGYEDEPVILTGHTGYLAIAHRTGQLDGLESDVIIGPEGQLLGAWAKVYNKTMSRAVEVKVSFNEYCRKRKDKTGKLVPMATWATKPESMIKKVAESQALRKAFNIKGIYTREEMELEIEKVPGGEIAYLQHGLDKRQALDKTQTVDTKPGSPTKSLEELEIELQAKIMDEINACDTEPKLRAVHSKYKADLGRMLDKDREYMQERFDSAFQALVSGPADVEVPREPGQDDEEDPKPKEAAPVELKAEPIKEDPKTKELREKDAFSRKYVVQAAKEIEALKTMDDLRAWKTKATPEIYKCLPEYSDYIKALFNDRYSKIQGATKK